VNRPWRRDVRLLALLADLIAITLAFDAAMWLRPALSAWLPLELTPAQMKHVAPPLGLILILWICAVPWIRLYRPRRGSAILSSLTQAVEAMALVLILTIVVIFFLRDFGDAFSRSFVFLFGALGVAAMLAGRGALWALLFLAKGGSLGAERALVVGAGEAAKALVQKLEATASASVRLCGVVTPVPGAGAGVLGNPVAVVGVVSQLPALINRYRADRVIVVDEEVPAAVVRECVVVCARMGIPLNRTVGAMDEVLTRMEVAEIADLPLLELRGVELTRFQLPVKRVFDLAASAMLLVLLAPLMLVLSALIKLSSRGPVLYVSQRVGRGGRYFAFYKFRSMIRDADAVREDLKERNEKEGHLFKLSGDPRVTRLGRFMRQYSLDELPQLLNVLLGDMSLVGPRPLPAADLDPDGLSAEHKIWARLRTVVRPGVTGLWQVRGRSSVGFDEMVVYDLTYIRRWSIGLDMKILLDTIPAVLSGKGAC